MTIESAEAIKKYSVGIKCATITPDEARVKGMDEYFANFMDLFKEFPAIIRIQLEGNVEVS